MGLPPVIEHIEPRCKVCQSPFRREIDACLAMGWSQAMVVSHFNRANGFEFLTRSNVSRHRSRHLTSRDAAVRKIIETRATQLRMDTEAIEGFILTRQATLDMIIQQGLESLRAGLSTSEPKDILAAVQMLEKMEQDINSMAAEEMTIQYKAFADAVQEVVPAEYHEKIFERTEAILQERNANEHVIRLEIPAVVEAEEDDYEDDEDV